jgi:hypothetical protein
MSGMYEERSCMSTTKDHKIILKCVGSGAKKVIKEIVGLGKGAPMITVSNQACFAKMSGCGLQEGRLKQRVVSKWDCEFRRKRIDFR